MNKDLISVIITTYKRPGFIKSAIENCIHQSYDNVELIIVDDNGVDTSCQLDTEEAIKEYNVLSNVSYYPLDKNRGACYARNFGVEKSNGDYIAFFDDDDEWTNTKLELQYNALSKTDDKTGMVLAGQRLINGKTNQVYSSSTYTEFDKRASDLLLNFGCSFATPNPLIRKSAFKAIGGFKEELKSSQDLEFGIRMSLQFKIISIEDFCLTSIVHSGTRISTNHAGKIQGFKYILSNYHSEISSEGRTYYWQRILMHSFFGALKSSAKESAKALKELNSFSLKYYCFYLGVFIPPLRLVLKIYLGLSKSLY